MKLHKIESDGEEYVFNIIHDFTEPCPQCGVPACGKEDIIWFEKNGVKESIVTNQSI